ncbi:MAG: glycerol kinase GlpK [Gammaproteobacteria bacterium]|nr:glycerol kinase GlpK [Gammaproteobacteria bacterium]
MDGYLLAIDQGTTSSKAILFSCTGESLEMAQQEFKQFYPADAWVEHDPEEIWASTLSVCQNVIKRAGIDASQIISIGISNQRETTLLWDRLTGKPLYNAIVWQDRRTAEYCAALKKAGLETQIQNKTGLLLDPYFSASKLVWLLDNVDGARALAEQGRLAFGTVDSFLLWRLTGGTSHMTDATNASRTLLFNIHNMVWDEELLSLFDIPSSLLPEVKNSSDEFGCTEKSLFGCSIPVNALIGDQQSALVGQACFKPGMGKCTYGTGCFLMLNSGSVPLKSSQKMLTTVAYQLDGQASYAIEGSIFIAGAVIQWLRDGLKIIDSAEDSERYAEMFPDSKGVYMVPAFTGLGAPHWDPDARGALLGLTRDTGIGEIVSASLQSVAYQTMDLLVAMKDDGACFPDVLRVDGGMANNRWFVQFLADILHIEVDTPSFTETTAFGAACLAGLSSGVYNSLDDLTALQGPAKRFTPALSGAERDELYAGWIVSLNRVKSKDC